MKIKKPKFWDKQFSFISIFLLPLSILINLINLFKRSFYKSRKFNLPIICIGNIYLGGTGKTPTSILLNNELIKRGKNPAVVRKFYKSHIDEHRLIEKYCNNLFCENDRISAIKKVINNDYDSAILDDGFQDSKIFKDCNIICFNQNQFIGNGRIIPAGPLRESLNTLKYAHAVIINGKQNELFEKKILKINPNLDIFYSKYRVLNANEFEGKPLLAFTGIGNPENFFKLMSQNNLNIKKKMVFPDHYQFKKNEITEIINESNKHMYHLVTTEKDYLRIAHFNFSKIKFLKINLEIDNLEKLIDKILKLYD